MPTQARINGTAKEKIKWLDEHFKSNPDYNDSYAPGTLNTFELILDDISVCLSENGQWWIEEET